MHILWSTEGHVFYKNFIIMNSLVKTRNYLRKFPYKSGKIGLAREQHNLFKEYNFCDGKYNARIINSSIREDAKKFMLENFYGLAPVPVALELYRNKNGETNISEFLEDEISLFFDCGVSFAIFHGDRVVGIGTNLIFNRFGKN